MLMCIPLIHFVSCSPEQSTQVKLYLLEILLSILQDAEQIPQRAVDTILMNILEPQKVC